MIRCLCPHVYQSETIMIFHYVYPHETMTPTKLRERLDEAEGRIDPVEYTEALQYVREDGR